jgi:hypothetical protein
MHFAVALGQGLADKRALTLPPGLVEIGPRTQFILSIDGQLMTGDDAAAQLSALGARLRYLADTSASVMPEVPYEFDRAAIALRLWAGCLAAAKTIADATLSGPNTAELRAQAFQWIDRVAEEDTIFCAGVETGPSFKRARNQPYSLEGVPSGSAVRRYLSDNP